jgi:hypothetical protein
MLYAVLTSLSSPPCRAATKEADNYVHSLKPVAA